MVVIFMLKGISALDVTTSVTSIDFSTEVNKGYADCSIELFLNDKLRAVYKTLDGFTEVKIYDNGLLLWEGRLILYEPTDKTLRVEAEGYYAILKDYYYNDGSEDMEVIQNYSTVSQVQGIMGVGAAGVGCLFTNHYLSGIGGYNCGVQSFSMKLAKIGDPTGKIIPFVSALPVTDMTVLGNNNPYLSYAVDVSSIEDTPNWFEIPVPNLLKLQYGQNYVVGFVVDSEYTASVGPSDYIAYYYDSVGTGGNTYTKTGSSWAGVPTRNSAFNVYSTGKWNYSTGAPCSEIVDDIVRYHQLELPDTPTLNSMAMLGNGNTYDFFSTPIDTIAYDAALKVLEMGSTNTRLLYIYVYEGRKLVLREVDYTKPPKAVISDRVRNQVSSINYGELVTEVAGFFELEDSIKSRTNKYYTNLKNTPKRQYYTDVGSVEDESEADIITQLETSKKSQVYGERSFTVKYGDLLHYGSGNPIKIYSIRAGDIVAINDFSRVTNGLIKYLVRATRYNPMTGEMQIDLAQSGTKEVLSSLLGVK